MPVADGPCAPWPIDPACCPSWPKDQAAWDAVHRIAVDIATDTLWRKTAGRYGLCEELVRPCRADCAEPGRSSSVLDPYIDNGRWFNQACGCRDGCHCGSLCTVLLPGPVHDVVQVKLDGHLVDDWSLLHRGGRTELVRLPTPVGPVPPRLDVVPDERDPSGMSVIAVIDNTATEPVGDGCWPTCQNLTLPDTEPGTFSVRYLRGLPVPPGGVRAVSALACEIVKQCQGAKDCRLPERVKTITREGISMDMFDPGEWLDNGLTGLREVDAWLREVNPGALKQPPAVYSLDLAPAPVSEGRYMPGRYR